MAPGLHLGKHVTASPFAQQQYQRLSYNLRDKMKLKEFQWYSSLETEIHSTKSQYGEITWKTLQCLVVRIIFEEFTEE